MEYLQDSLDKEIFSPFYEDSPLDWCCRVKVDTKKAKQKTLDLMKKCKCILELLDKVERDAK